MSRRIRVKPSKPASLFGMIIGIVFVFIGLFIVIPNVGLFGVFWTLIALGITCSQAYSFFSNKGVASWEMDIETDKEPDKIIPTTSDDFEVKLRKLNKLKEDGLITEEEFQKKREEIMNREW